MPPALVITGPGVPDHPRTVLPATTSLIAAALLTASARLAVTSVATFGANPGALELRLYAPARLRPGRPLVVVLHGCGQDPTDFAADSGWLSLAQQLRLALVLPQQVSDNNRARCFNWYRPQDVGRGLGEAASIRQMVRHAVRRFGSDPKRIYVVGFSAGAAMTAALLAAYPALFAAGGVVAGFPVGAAHSTLGAVLNMRRPAADADRTLLADRVRRAAPARKTWPRVTIWQGERDRTVAPGNAEALGAQWSELHGFGAVPTTDQAAGGVRWRSWGRPDRPPAVDLWTLSNIGHAFPVDSRTPACGRTGAWVADAGLCAARHIAGFWGLTPPRA